MSKRVLYGKNWHTVINKNEPVKRYIYKRKMSDDGFIIQAEERSLNKITNEYKKKNLVEDDKKFLEKFYSFQKIDINLEKYNAGNSLFKLKGVNAKPKKYDNLKNADEVLNILTVVYQSDDLKSSLKKSNENKTKKEQIFKKEIEKKLNDEYNSGNLADEIDIEGIKITLINMSTQKITNDDIKIKVGYIIDEEIQFNNKKDIYHIFKSINTSIYFVINEVLKDKKIYYNKNYIKLLQESINQSLLLKDQKGFTKLKSIQKSFNDIKCIVNCDNDLIVFLLKWLNLSTGDEQKKVTDNKLIFDDKIERFLRNKLNKITLEDISEYIFGELVGHNLVKQVLPVTPEINDRKINTYIKYDKHEKYKNSSTVNKDERVKSLIEKISEGDEFKLEFNNIFNNFKVEELAIKIKNKIQEHNGKADNYLFSLYRNHYNECYLDIAKNNGYENVNDYFNNQEDYKKAMYKLIQDYLKGRINKCVVNNKFIDFGINNVETTRDKTLLRVKQYIIEHIIYVGKLNRMGISKIQSEDISRRFQIDHAEEELNTELLVLFASINVFFNQMLRKDSNERIVEFFGGGIDVSKLNFYNMNEYTYIMKQLNFIEFVDGNGKCNDDFSEFLKKCYNLRNGLIHNNITKIDSLKSNLGEDDENKFNEKIENVLSDYRPSDVEISRSNNLQVVFKNKSFIINNINNLEYINKENEKYFPSYSKITKYIKNKLKENKEFNSFDDATKAIVENAVLYVNSVLYKKYISIDSNVNEILKIAFKGTDSLEKRYKNAQSKASKGDRRAIKKYQEKLAEAYLKLICEDKNEFFKMFVFEHSEFLDIEKEIMESQTEFDNGNSDFVLQNIISNISIKSNYENIIATLCLLSDTKYSSLIKNRIFSTMTWLESFVDESELGHFNRLISTLDEIIKVKNLYKNNRFINVQDKYYTESDDENINQVDVLSEYQIYLDVKNKISNGDEFCKQKTFEYIKKCINNCNSDADKKFFGIVKNEFNDDNYKNSLQFIVYNQNKERFILKPGADGKKYGKYIGKIKLDVDKLITEFNKYFTYLNGKKIAKYKETIDEIIEIGNNDELKNVYKQGINNDIYIFKKNIFDNLSKNTFDNIWKIFKDEFKNLEYIESKNICDDIKLVDDALGKINTKYKGKSLQYKNYEYKKIRNTIDFNQITGHTRTKFEESYNKVKNYKINNDKIEFNNISRINNYLIEINWKLAIQAFRLERDLHNLIVGYFKIVHNKDIIKEVEEKKSVAYLNNKAEIHYINLDKNNYNNYIELTKFLGLDIKKDLVEERGLNNVRNYFAHFEFLKEPFKDNLSLKVKELDDLLKYRKRYQNSTVTSLLEVFKGDVEIDYDKLKNFNIQSDNADITKLYSNSKIKSIDMEYYIDNKKIVDMVLTSKS